jgi:hypothetical protein
VRKIYNNDKRRKEMAIGKVVVYSCIKLIMKELKNSVDQVRVVTTLNIC